MAGKNRTRREDGPEYASQIVGEGACEYCGNTIMFRLEGRPPRFCSPSCRSGAHRRSRPQWRTRKGIQPGQSN